LFEEISVGARVGEVFRGGTAGLPDLLVDQQRRRFGEIGFEPFHDIELETVDL
jgi:hypothetical protein